jgi:hypothetical protein
MNIKDEYSMKIRQAKNVCAGVMAHRVVLCVCPQRLRIFVWAHYFFFKKNFRHLKYPCLDFCSKNLIALLLLIFIDVSSLRDYCLKMQALDSAIGEILTEYKVGIVRKLNDKEMAQ